MGSTLKSVFYKFDPVLLWQNSDTKSSFAAQTIDVPGLSEYKLYLITYQLAAGDNAYLYSSGVSYKLCGNGKTIITASDDTLYYRNVLVDAANNQISFTVVQYVQQWNAYNGTLTGRIIPVAVYGVK